MSKLDAAVHVGRESTYGTRVEPTRSFEATQDPAERQVEFLESTGMRAGMHTIRADRRRIVTMGAEGPLTVDVLDRGFGMLLRAMVGDSQIDAGPTAFEQTHAATPGGPDESLTVQVERPPVEGDTVAFEYPGGVVASWQLTQSNDGLLVCELTMDYQTEDTQASPATPVYPAGARPFAWVDCEVLVDGSPVDPEDFQISGDNNRKTDRRALRRSSLKKKPVRQGLPTYEGELSKDFEDLDTWNKFIAGDPVPLVARWLGREIPGAEPQEFALEVECAAVQLGGSTPQVEDEDLTGETVPFRVLHNGTDPAVVIRYISDDDGF